MMIAVVGSPASASTWAYNVMRAMLALGRPGALSLYAESAGELLENIPVGCKDVVIKAHSVDAALLKLLSAGEARIIITDRNPQDSTVSQIERFALSETDILRQLSRAYASMAMVQATLEVLLLRYEDRFYADPGTVRRMADWAGIAVSDMEIADIFKSLEAAALKKRLTSWTEELNAAGEAPTNFAERHDHATQLHPNHVGDGRIGKGMERLSPERCHVLADCFDGFGANAGWRSRAIRWSSALFNYSDDRTPSEKERLCVSGEEGLLVYGPYLYLPTGYWRAVPLIRMEYDNLPLQLLADVFTGNRGVVQLRVFTLPACNVNRIALEFEHVDHLDPIEIRFSSIRDGNQVHALFSGVELNWLGPPDPRPGLSAREVHDRGIFVG